MYIQHKMGGSIITIMKCREWGVQTRMYVKKGSQGSSPRVCRHIAHQSMGGRGKGLIEIKATSLKYTAEEGSIPPC